MNKRKVKLIIYNLLVSIFFTALLIGLTYLLCII